MEKAHFCMSERASLDIERYPSHGELCRDFHKIAGMVHGHIVRCLGWEKLGPGDLTLHDGRDLYEGLKLDEFEEEGFYLEFEVGYWDIVLKPQFNLLIPILDEYRLMGFAMNREALLSGKLDQEGYDRRMEKVGSFSKQILIEYKSSTREWGKQFDAYIRQIKKRKNPSEAPMVLLSFDPEFLPYIRAAQTSGFEIVVLHPRLLEFMKIPEKEIENGVKSGELFWAKDYPYKEYYPEGDWEITS